MKSCETGLGPPTRVRQMNLRRSYGDMDGGFRQARFILQTDRKHWHFEFVHQGGGAPDFCRFCLGEKHSPVDCPKYWSHASAVEAAITLELHDEPSQAAKAIHQLKLAHDTYLGLRKR